MEFIEITNNGIGATALKNIGVTVNGELAFDFGGDAKSVRYLPGFLLGVIRVGGGQNWLVIYLLLGLLINIPD